jgi:hypothetical protein
MRVMNREKVLAAIANRGPEPIASPVQRQTPKAPNLAEFAAARLVELAWKRPNPSMFTTNLAYVSNRHPRMARIANRQAGFDALADLEPVAHEKFLEAVQMPPGTAYPRWRWEDFLARIAEMSVQYPDLGYEGRFQKLKETDPDLYWKWVLTFDENRPFDGESPLLYPQEDADKYRSNGGEE